MHRLKRGKTRKFGFLRWSSGFVCSDENMFCTKCRRTLWGKNWSKKMPYV